MSWEVVPPAEVPTMIAAMQSGRCVSCYERPRRSDDDLYCATCDPPELPEDQQRRLEFPSRVKVTLAHHIAWDMSFKGCDDRDPDHCSCATHEDVVCLRCEQLVEEGERIVILTRHTTYDGYPDADEWEYEIRHETCPAVTRC